MSTIPEESAEVRNGLCISKFSQIYVVEVPTLSNCV